MNNYGNCIVEDGIGVVFDIIFYGIMAIIFCYGDFIFDVF